MCLVPHSEENCNLDRGNFTNVVYRLGFEKNLVFQALTDKLKKANRILRVLENVSHENEENCNYLIAYGREGGEEDIHGRRWGREPTNFIQKVPQKKEKKEGTQDKPSLLG